jgi:Mycothiol maleylpyruvate isomerase N-terminal domain
MASERAAALADDFARANAEAVAFVRGCNDDAWVRPVPGEGWTVGVVVHHIAESYADSSRWLREMACGDGVTETAVMIDEANAAHAARAASVTPAETLVLLGDGGARLEDVLRACSDEELDRCAPFGPAGGRLVPTVELAAVPARHTREHLSRARRAASGSV